MKSVFGSIKMAVLILLSSTLLLVSCEPAVVESENDYSGIVDKEDNTISDSDSTEIPDEDEDDTDLFEEICQPQCDGKSCGDDNECGGICVPQTCGEGNFCSIEGECVSVDTVIEIEDPALDYMIRLRLEKGASEPVTINDLGKITDFEVDSQNVEDIKPIYYMVNLETLWVKSNGLTEVPDNIFKHLERLNELILWEPIISVPPDIFRGLASIERISFLCDILRAPSQLFANLSLLQGVGLGQFSDSGTIGLEKIDGNLFNGSSNLTDLWISSNLLEIVPEDLLSGQSNLEELFIESGKHFGFPEEFFKDTPNLTKLTINQGMYFNTEPITTKITNNMLGHLTKMKELKFRGFVYEIEPQTFDNMLEFKNADFFDNHISKLDENLLSANLLLKSVDFSFNDIKNISQNMFINNTELKYLYLGNMFDDSSIGNIIPSGLFDSLNNLMTLYLEKNGLIDLPVGIFNNLASLEELYLKDNYLTDDIPTDSFINLDIIRNLDLRNNCFSEEYSPDIPNVNTKGEELSLGLEGNPDPKCGE